MTAREQLAFEKTKATNVLDNGVNKTVKPIYSPEVLVVAVDAIIENEASLQASDALDLPSAVSGSGFRKVYAKAIVSSAELVNGANTISLGIPENAIILNSVIDVTETFADGVSDASTIGIGVETVTAGSEDIVNAVAISDSGNPFDVGISAGIPVSAATAIKLSADKDLTVNVVFDGEIEAFTAGAMDIYLEYIIGE